MMNTKKKIIVGSLGLALVAGIPIAATAANQGFEPLSLPANESLTEDGSPLRVWYGEIAFVDGRQAALLNKVEARIVTCMAERGFTYNPVDQVALEKAVTTPQIRNAKDAAKWGYGVDISRAEGTITDANAVAYEALSADQKAGYDRAMYGTGKGEQESTDPDQVGCSLAAFNELFTPADKLLSSAPITKLDQAVARLEKQIHANKQARSADEDWARCMADAGFGAYRSPDDALTWFNDNGDQTDKASELKAFQDKQKKVAVADFTCRDKVDYLAKTLPIRYELEDRFMTTHKAVLDAAAVVYEKAGL